MLQCPNCKEDRISYLGTFGSIPGSPDLCPACNDIFEISGFDILKKTLFAILGGGIMMVLTINILNDPNKFISMVFGGIGFLIFDYIAYKNFITPRKYKSVDSDSGIKKVRKNGIGVYLRKLTESKENNPFIVIFDNNTRDRYIDIFYENNFFTFNLSLVTGRQKTLKDIFYTVSKSLGYKVEVDYVSDNEEYLKIRVTDNLELASDILHKFTKQIFRLDQISDYYVMPSGIGE